MHAEYQGIKFSDEDVVNRGEFIAANDNYNPHRVRPFLLHDHGFTLAVVFASNLQDAIDEAVDAGKLDCYQVSPADMKDYPDEEGLSFLGNACEPFDIESLGAIELPNPSFSFVALFNASQK